MWGIVLILVAVVIALWKLYVRKVDQRFRHTETGEPMPGPPPSFLGLNGLIWYWQGAISGLVKQCKHYGPVCRVFVGPYAWIIITQHSANEDLFLKSKTFHKGVFADAVARIIPGSLSVIDGKEWRVHRAVLQPFFSEKEMSRTADSFAMITRNEFDKLPEGKEFNVQNLTSNITSKILMKSLFNYGFEENPNGEKLQKEALSVIKGGGGDNQLLLMQLLPFLARTDGFRKRVKEICAPFFKIIDIIKQSSTGHTLWDKLEFKDGNRFTWQEFQYESLGLLLAGFETTSTALCWVLWSMDKYPDVKAKLQKEIRDVIGDRLPTVDDLKNLLYLDSYILECLRYHGPIRVVNRVAVANETLEGYRIPVGTEVFTSLHDIVKASFENPDEFNPERFSGEDYAVLAKCALTNFGTGPHVCIGKHLALLELKLIAAYLIQTNQIHVNLETNYVNPKSVVYVPRLMTAVKLPKKSN